MAQSSTTLLLSVLILILMIVQLVVSAPTVVAQVKPSTDSISHQQQQTDQQPPMNIIRQVIKALDGREDMIQTIEYLEASADDEDLLKQLPLVDALDGKANAYTFLAPTSWAIHRAIPQDIANPFSYDQQLRHDIFLRHFIRRLLTKEDLEKDDLIELTMADTSRFNLTRGEEGERLIDERAVIMTKENIDIRVGSGETGGSNNNNIVRIFVVDGVLILEDEMSAAISRNPNPVVSPWALNVDNADAPAPETSTDVKSES